MKKAYCIYSVHGPTEVSYRLIFKEVEEVCRELILYFIYDQFVMVSLQFDQVNFYMVLTLQFK